VRLDSDNLPIKETLHKYLEFNKFEKTLDLNFRG
jgi:hypothetical protein